MKKVLDILKNVWKTIKSFFVKIWKFICSKISFLKKFIPEEKVEYFDSEAIVQRESKADARKNKKTLGLVIMLAGSLVVLVISVVTCIVNCSLSYGLAEQYINEEITSGLNAYQAVVNTKMNAIRLQVEKVALSDDIYTGNMQMNTRKSLLEKKTEGTDFKDFSIAYSDGKTYSDTDISQRDYFKEAMNGTTYISSPLVRQTDGSITIMCGAKISSLTFTGVAYGGIDYTIFSQMIDSMKIGENSSTFILDKNGTIIAHPNDGYVRDMKTFAQLSEEEGPYFAGAAVLAAKMVAGETGVERVNYLGQECYIGYIPIGNIENWSLAVIIPSAAAFNALNTSIITNIIVVIILLILAAVVFMVISNIIAKPINLITERIGLLAEGDLYSEVPKIKSTICETKMLHESLTGVTDSLSAITTDIDRVLGGLAEKNLLVRPDTEYHGDYRSIRNSLITISNSLNLIVRSLEKVSNDVSNGSEQILSSSQNLAQSTIQQSSSLDNLYENITQISERIEANVGITTKANNLVSDTVQRANASTEKMAQMVASMGEITKTSEQIDIIIQTIDEIAFQTNILALNAAVEAAKAGEAGKGFAVVADEVGNLASKSAEAASNTAKLIEESIAAVHKGEEIADETAVALNEIVRNIDQINEFMTQIADASNEQAQRITGINESMTVISALTQSTSATSEQCAAASHEFSNHSSVLRSIVEDFKTN